ncbi:MAG TPA: glycerate kinase, partial [Acidimicrobiales bacterium]|nr:glycerate kinase [Acidimicrobiales bacterium]
VLAGGAAGNDPTTATTAGVGELILAAAQAGATSIVVGCGGSATTDGGAGAVGAIGSARRLGRSRLVVACDVAVTFTEAARLFGPQKGASAEEVGLLTGRLEELAERYEKDFGRAVGDLPGSGAAGGLAGGLAALGAELVAGIDLVAAVTRLDDLIARAGVVVTGEGRLDAGSFAGKVVGGVAKRCAGQGAAVVCGQSDAQGRRLARSYGLEVLDLSHLHGLDSALAAGPRLITEAVAGWLASL